MQLAWNVRGPGLACWWLGLSPLVIDCSAWGPRAGGGAEPAQTPGRTPQWPSSAPVSPHQNPLPHGCRTTHTPGDLQLPPASLEMLQGQQVGLTPASSQLSAPPQRERRVPSRHSALAQGVPPWAPPTPPP